MCRVQITVWGPCTHFLSEMETNIQCWECLAGVNQNSMKQLRQNTVCDNLTCMFERTLVQLSRCMVRCCSTTLGSGSDPLVFGLVPCGEWTRTIWCRTQQRTRVNWIDRVWEILQNTKTTLSWKWVQTKSCVWSLRCVKGAISRTWVVTHWCCWTVSAADIHQLRNWIL